MEAVLRFVKHCSSGQGSFRVDKPIHVEWAIAALRDYYNERVLSQEARKDPHNRATDTRNPATIRFPSYQMARKLFDDSQKKILEDYTRIYIPALQYEIVERIRQMIVSVAAESMADADGSITIQVSEVI